MKMKTVNKIGLLAMMLALLVFPVNAQEIENEFQSRTQLELSFKPAKKLKISLMPQFRFDEDFSLDKYLLETGAEYKAFKHLELEASYRFVVNPRKTKDTEYLNRFAFGATAKKEFGRFSPSFRLRYSNYADDDVTDKTFMRYKAALKYDIPKCKIIPSVAAEAFQQFEGGDLYKMRYSAGLDYKIFKKNYLGVNYKFEYYKKEYKNRHIISLGYKIKF